VIVISLSDSEEIISYGVSCELNDALESLTDTRPSEPDVFPLSPLLPNVCHPPDRVSSMPAESKQSRFRTIMFPKHRSERIVFRDGLTLIRTKDWRFDLMSEGSENQKR
jgi:hypothetical protein